MYCPAKSVPSSFNPSDEPAYACPFASYNFPNNPIPKPASITPPTAPTSLVITNITSSGFTVSWTPGLGAVDYVVTWGTFTQAVFGTSAVFSGLPESTTNNCTVTAINAGGSAISAPTSVTTGTNIPSGLAVSNVTSTGFLCSWNYVAGVTYTLSWGAFNGTVTGNGTGSFTGLTGQTTNNFVVTGNGQSSAPLSVTTAPSTPTGFAVTRRGTTYLNISWTYNPGVTYNIVLGTYTGTITGNGTGRWAILPQAYSGTLQISATNQVGTASASFGTQTLLSPVTFDTGNQVQTSGAIGFYLAVLNPGTFTVPANFDIQNNGTNKGTYATMPYNFVTFNGGFDYDPPQPAGLFAYRWASTTVPNPNGSGNPGDSWMADVACATTGNTAEFRNLTQLNPASVWNFAPGDVISTWLLIAYGAWIYRTQSGLDPGAIPAFWRIAFTYNPFSPT